MASAIASPTPLHPSVKRPTRTELQMQDEGRGTPLPQYEKTQSVPFTLTLQEEKSNPGQFQLVVNIDPQHRPPSDGAPPTPATSKRLYANLNDIPGLGLNPTSLYQTQKSSPPVTPSHDKQEWSDLDAIPPDFLQKVVPDWKVTFSRSDSTASTQSKRLSDIKARIKKKGKGYVVRLLKGSDPESNEVAEVHLGQQSADDALVAQELHSESCVNAVELDATNEQSKVFEIGSSNEPGIQQTPVAPPALPTTQQSAIPNWLNKVNLVDPRPRNSIAEEGFSDAETLLPDVRSVIERFDEEQTDAEPFSYPSSNFPTRSASVFSIVKTPTRGLSVVGPVRRIEKSHHRRGKGKGPRLELNRSDAHKSLKRRSPNHSLNSINTEKAISSNEQGSSVLRNRFNSSSRHDIDSTNEWTSAGSNAWQSGVEQQDFAKQKLRRGTSAEEFLSPSKAKTKLKLQTNVPRPKSANTSPVSRRKRSPRTHKPTSSTSSSVSWAEDVDQAHSANSSKKLREAIEQAFNSQGEPDADEEGSEEQAVPSIPRIQEPVDDSQVGEILLPAELEIRTPPVTTKSPIMTFWGLALSGLAGKALEGFHLLRQRYGSEPPVPPKHVRVRWTCSCGEPLYDDFIERRPGAARLLEAYLNRPRAHTPASPTSRSSTATSMSSVFSSASTASTLATPSSTYGGPSSWGRHGESSKYSPTRLRTTAPFNIPMGSFAEESWLLTCANEGRFTPKIVHVDVNAGRIRSDKDLALAIREHYEQLNRHWYSWIRLRGLTTIEFVQFEVHRNRFADIRATPSMPPTSSSSSPSPSASSEKASSPSQHPYNFEPIDLLPPVGSTYLLHLFQHPSDYDGELITYLRSPKRRERLEFGMGWGINLVEGFLAQRVWLVLMAMFGMGSAVFALFWTIKKGDVQGAFGVAAWLLGLAGLVLGCLQAWLE